MSPPNRAVNCACRPSAGRGVLPRLLGHQRRRPSSQAERAYQGNADITRDINGKVLTGRVLTSDPLLPGDTVYVRERLF